MNQSCVTLRSASGSGLGYRDGVEVSVLVVGRNKFKFCFSWPFVIDGERGGCFEISCSASHGQVVRCPFFIALTNVEGAGIKHAAWRNWDNYLLVLFIWTISLDDCVGLLGSFNGIF